MVSKSLDILRYLLWVGLILALPPFLSMAKIDAVTNVTEGSWVDGYKNRARLFTGAVKDQPFGDIYIFVEIEMDKGWKTYWRNPGTAGGIAPEFDFRKSANIRSVEVLYPVPDLYRDGAGETIGYKEHVIFPVIIRPENTKESVDVNLTANYGICEKLCVPVEVNLSLYLPPDVSSPPSHKAQTALAAVPHNKANIQPGDPFGLTVKQMLSHTPPRVTLSANFPGSAEMALMFLDVEGGLFIPIPDLRNIEGQIATFELDLSDPEILKSLQGSKVRVTMKGQKGQSEDSFILQ